MQLDSKIYVAGHRGLAGSALVRELGRLGYGNLVTRTHGELDLTEQAAVREFFQAERPEYVFLAAAKVGGILANDTYPADFVDQNLAIQTNVIAEARASGVRRLLFLGSSCIYPRDCPQPIREDYLLTGPLEATNRAYAIAKIAGIEMCRASNRQHGTRYIAAMPTNLYGPGDNYDLRHSHVLPALLRKVHEARVAGAPSVEVWGTGKVRREFLYSEDMAAACVFLMRLPEEKFSTLLESRADQPPLVNVGTGEDVTILELAQLIKDVVGYEGSFTFDSTKPDGTPRKLLDVSLVNTLGWRAKTDLREGIALAHRDFVASHMTA